MDERLKNHAVLLFHEKYGKNPEEEGLVVDYDRKRDAFLYSTSQKAIDAFKHQQDILMGIMKYFFGSLFACLAVEGVVLVVNSAELLTCMYVAVATVVFWGIILAVLAAVCIKQEKEVRKNPVVFIPNEEYDD